MLGCPKGDAHQVLNRIQSIFMSIKIMVSGHHFLELCHVGSTLLNLLNAMSVNSYNGRLRLVSLSLFHK